MTPTNQPHPESATRWVREPGPGQFRGEGEWKPFTGSDDEWEWLVRTGYLPTRALATRTEGTAP